MGLHGRTTDANADADADAYSLWNGWMREPPTRMPMSMPTLVYWNDEGGANANADANT